MTTELEWRKSIQRSIDAEEAENKLKAKRISRAKRARDYELRMIAENEKRRGYCPHCFTLLPISGICACGYIKEDK